jgi:hypothetical protein
MPLPNDDRDGLRRCRDCGEWKPLEEFHFSPRRPSGRGSYCKPCYNKRAQASYAKRLMAKEGREVRKPREVPDGHRYCPDCETIKPLAEFPRNRAKRSGHERYCKPCHNVKGRENRIKNHGSTREYHLRRRYGIGDKEVRELLAEQGGVCAICGAESPEHVDHDYETGYIRGIAIDYLRDTTCRILIHPGVYQVRSPRRGRLPSHSS